MTSVEQLSADELEELARLRLTPAVYDYVAGGAGDERTLTANRDGFARLRLRPRILTGVARVSAEASVLGMALQAPVFVAPMGGPAHNLVCPDGVAAAAGGAADAGVGYMVSASSVDTLDLPGGAGRVCQVYVVDREATAALIEQAEGLGYGAVCLTADVPVPALRRRNLRHGVAQAAPGQEAVRQGGYANHASYARPATWDDVAWLRSLTKLPVLLKGVMTAEDARLALDAGVDGVVVSNHGGRQLDQALGTIEVLPEVVEAVGGRAAVVLDGGVRSSTDVALALALGADAVGMGKAVMWALAAGGRTGVANFLRSIVTELVRTLTLLGVSSVTELNSAHVDTRFARS